MSNNTSDGIESLNEAYEDGLFRLVMSEVAKEEGKLLIEEIRELKSIEENHPSQKEINRFTKLLDKELKQAKKNQKTKRMPKVLSRTLASAAAVVIIFSTLMITVRAFRIQVLNFLISIGPEYTTLQLEDNNNEKISGNLDINWTNSYMPSFVPEGFTVKKATYTDPIKHIRFFNQETDSFIIYSEYSPSVTVAVDTEGALIKSITINGNAATFSEKGSVISIAWSMDNRIFLIQGNLSAEDAVKMAEGVKYYSKP